jgi:hypothetical protein
MSLIFLWTHVTDSIYSTICAHTHAHTGLNFEGSLCRFPWGTAGKGLGGGGGGQRFPRVYHPFITTTANNVQHTRYRWVHRTRGTLQKMLMYNKHAL